MRIYRSEDRIGVGLGSCLKTPTPSRQDFRMVLDSVTTRGLPATRSMNEMMALGVSLGGKAKLSSVLAVSEI